MHTKAVAITFTLVCGLSFLALGQESSFHTKKEKDAIDKFRPLVEKYLTLDYMKTDSYLLRWLKTKKFDLNAAVQLLKESYQWRKENNIDALLTEDMKSHQRAFPYTLDSVDRKGQPVLQLYFGKWNIRRYVLAGKRDVVLRYWWQLSERLEQKAYELSKSTGKDINKFYYLNDMDGYSLRKHACLQCIPLMLDLVRTYDPHHPYFLSNVTLVNSPRIFSPVLSLMKQIVPGPTLNVINDYGHDKAQWKPILHRDIDPSQLTPNFGGTMKMEF